MNVPPADPALAARLEELEAAHRQACDDYAGALAHVTQLAATCSALARLHGTLERREVLLAVQEIVVNLLGSEELAIYEWDERAGVLRLAASVGLEGLPAAAAMGEGEVGVVALRRAPLLRPERAHAAGAGPTACVPLVAGDRLVGVLAVHRLLSHKSELVALDGELLDLLGRQAGVALYLTSLHAARVRG